MRPCRWVCLLLALTATARAAEDEVPLVWARFALAGPLERAELIGTRGVTILDLGLRTGERREFEVPCAHVSSMGPPRVAGASEFTERVRFLGWVERSIPALPAPLRARPRPPWRPAAPRVPAALALMLVALGPVTFALRRRPMLLAVVGPVAAALAVLVQARAAPPAAPPQRALEGSRDGLRWLAVDVARELELAPAAPFVLAVEPPGARVELRVSLREGAPRYAAASPDGTLVRRRTFDPGLRLLTPTLNTWGPFEAVWSRPAQGGDWLEHGPWGLGEAPASGVPGRPPGWLAAGAVQGRGILVARLARAAWDGGGVESVSPTGRETWLRLVGFE